MFLLGASAQDPSAHLFEAHHSPRPNELEQYIARRSETDLSFEQIEEEMEQYKHTFDEDAIEAEIARERAKVAAFFDENPDEVGAGRRLEDLDPAEELAASMPITSFRRAGGNLLPSADDIKKLLMKPANRALFTAKELKKLTTELFRGGIMRALADLVHGSGEFFRIQKAANYEQKRQACRRLSKRNPVKFLKILAHAIDATISIASTIQMTILTYDYTWGGSMIVGEGGQFACAELESHGWNLAGFGGGWGVTATISPTMRNLNPAAAIAKKDLKPIGGWSAVSANWESGIVCLTVDFPFAEMFKTVVAVDIRRMGSQNRAINAVTDYVKDIRKKMGNLKDFAEFFDRLSNALMLQSGIFAVGLTAGPGADITDFIPYLNMVPTVTVAGCVEKLIHCDDNGDGSCAKKAKINPWPRGQICAVGFNCHKCDEPATWWHGKFAMACGNEPKWGRGRRCWKGKYGSCNVCKEKATYWWGKAWWACGKEPGTPNGWRCLAGTTCNACLNTYHWWPSKFTFACGTEPCWRKNSVCGYGTTCRWCCKGAPGGYCPWYWFGVCKCK